MKVKNIISMISAADEIIIYDGEGILKYKGYNGEFRATCKYASQILEYDIRQITAIKSVIIIMCEQF